MTPFVWSALGVLIVVSGFAILNGGRPERLAAMAAMAATIANYVSRHLAPVDDPLPMMIVDFLHFAVVLLLALRYRRAWLQPYAGLLLLPLTTGVAFGVDTGPGYFVYMTVMNIWGVAALLALAAGVALEAAPSRRSAAVAVAAWRCERGAWRGRTAMGWLVLAASICVAGVLLYWLGVAYRLWVGGVLLTAWAALSVYTQVAPLRPNVTA